MTKPMGRIHGPQCDCHSTAVTGYREKCHKIHGNKRQRARERQETMKEIRNDLKSDR